MASDIKLDINSALKSYADGWVRIDGVLRHITDVWANVNGVLKKINLGGAGGIDANTKLMLHLNGINGSTVFTDSSLTPKTVTAYGGVQISTAQSKFGGGSGLLNGTTDYLSIADSSEFAFGTNDFTIDFWTNFNALPTTGTLITFFSKVSGTANADYMNLSLQNQSGVYSMRFIAIAAAVVLADTASRTVTLATGTWYHIALVKISNIYRIYVNGVQLGVDYSSAASIPQYTSPLYIGTWMQLGTTPQNFVSGYPDELRISKGVARWTANFTPPISEYTT